MTGPFKERERKGKPWDAEKRGPGGQARAAAIKKKGTLAASVRARKDLPPEASSPPPKAATIRATPAASSPPPEEDFLANDGFDFPAPGEHPKHLVEAAKEQGARTPQQGNPFAKKPTIRAKPVSNAQTPGEVSQQDSPQPPKKGPGFIPRKIDYSARPTNPSAPAMPPEVEESDDLADGINVPERKAPRARKSLPIIRASQGLTPGGSAEDGISAMLSLTETVCDSCPVQETCEHFEEGSFCAYTEALQGLSSRRKEDVLPLLEGFTDMHVIRAKRAVLFESRLAGGQLSGDVTRQIEIARAAVIQLDAIKNPPMPAPRNVTTVSISQETTEAPKQGILSQLIAGIAGKTEPKKATLETEGIELNPALPEPPATRAGGLPVPSPVPSAENAGGLPGGEGPAQGP